MNVWRTAQCRRPGERALREFQRQGSEQAAQPGDPLHAEKARVLIGNWRCECNKIRPHSSLEYRASAPETLALRPVLVGAIGGDLV